MDSSDIVAVFRSQETAFRMKIEKIREEINHEGQASDQVA